MIEFEKSPAIEDQIIQASNIMKSKFGLIAEEVNMDQLEDVRFPKKDLFGQAFKNEIERLLPEIVHTDGKVLIFEMIATQHAISTLSALNNNGFDVNFAFIPENKSIRTDITRGSYHQTERVVEIALAEKDSIIGSKENLTKENLKGVVLVIDPHAHHEDCNGEFNRFLPSKENLENLGIKSVVVLGEFPPENAEQVAESRIDNKKDWDKSCVYEYLRSLKRLDIPVKIYGVDRRV